MANGGPKRDLIRIVFTNFINSFRPRQIRGNFMGEDYFGNKYYEIPADPSIGKRKASRWFEPPEKDDFDQERTAEWDAWLRGRRNDPPTREELVQNLKIMEMKKHNAALLEEKFPKSIESSEPPKAIGSFPTYKEYELNPGSGKTK